MFQKGRFPAADGATEADILIAFSPNPFVVVEFTEHGIKPALECDEDVEVTERSSEKGRYLFVLNHSNEEKQITSPGSVTDIMNGTEYAAGDTISLKEKDVKILRS